MRTAYIPKLSASLLASLLLAPMSALACGENQFSTGQGLRYQGYLTPRPATVVVVDDGSGERDGVYAGLAKAGHQVTVVSNSEGLGSALAAGKVDVVIADLADVDSVAAQATGATHLLPVVARSARNAPEMRQRFDLFLLEGASLGQYLKSIDRLVRTPRG